EALEPTFKTYSQQVISNAQAFAKTFLELGYQIVSGGTDNHLFLLDLRNKGVTGKEAEELWIRADITTNKNMIPFDPQPPMTTSGIRLGTPAMTSRGFKENEFVQVAHWMDEILSKKSDAGFIEKLKVEINKFMKDYPLYPEINP
ncbi:MAG TPA: serine hydroxymethyltransferase, partial [Saprospiraceae bacterium]|nr:serine hydroxymethyltransferase [Saprospiraceae bacterium]